MRWLMKRRAGFALCLALVLWAGARCAVVFGLATRDRTTSRSPNGAHALEVASTSRSDFWGGAPHDIHEIRLFSGNGELLNRLSVDDRASGWQASCAIEWSAEQASVVCVLRRENQECGRVVLPLRK